MNKKVKSSGLCLILISFVLSALFCFIIWAVCGIYPGSSRTILNCDMLWQYVAFFDSLKSIIKGENSIFYNWSLYLGSNFLGLYAYYLASPLSWLTVFWKTEDMPTAIYFLCLLKIALSGASFSAFLYFRPKDNYQRNLQNNLQNNILNDPKSEHNLKLYISILFFSVCYALMGYNMMYIICPMWIDSVIMLPIVILGLERLISEKKTVLYCISIGLSFIFNFYTAYMIAVFTILYFIYYYFSTVIGFKASDFFKTFGRYVINSILGGCMAMVLLLPTAHCLFQGKVGDETTYFYGTFTHNLFEILSRFFTTTYDSIHSNGLPCVFCGSICVLLAIYNIVRGERKSGKIASAAVLLFLILSMWITPLNRAWHIFKDPIWFPFRYSFVISFFILTLAFGGFGHLSTDIKKITNLSKYSKLIYIVAVAFTFIELFLCGSNCRNCQVIETETALDSTWEYFTVGTGELIDSIVDAEGISVISDSDFRVSSEISYTYDDPMLGDYKGINSFSSVYNNDELVFMKRLGYRQDDYELYQLGGTLITDSILAVKYKITDNNESFYSKVASNYYGILYRNNFALPLAYVVADGQAQFPDDGNVFEFQNNILNSFSGDSDDYFKKIEYVTDLYSYDNILDNVTDSIQKLAVTVMEDNDVAQNCYISFQIPEDGYVYLYVKFNRGDDIDSINVYNNYKEFFLNGELINKIDFGGYTNILNLGFFNAGDECNLMITNCTAGDNIFLAELDEEAVEKSLQILSENPSLKNISISNGNLSGTISMDNDGTLFMTVPYDEGWSVYVDGKKVSPIKCLDAFVGLELQQGEHSITMKYVSPLFIAGLIISIFALLIKICLEVVLYKNGKKSA